jgi:hypothetical protein
MLLAEIVVLFFIVTVKVLVPFPVTEKTASDPLTHALWVPVPFCSEFQFEVVVSQVPLSTPEGFQKGSLMLGGGVVVAAVGGVVVVAVVAAVGVVFVVIAVVVFVVIAVVVLV